VQAPHVKDEHFGLEAGQSVLATHSLQLYEITSHFFRVPVQSASVKQATQVPDDTRH
jgi:hypothetical protein